MGVFLTTSSDRARTFSAPRQVLGPLNFSVRMAIDRSSGPKGRLHLVWVKATSDPPSGSFGPPPNPIMASHSDDGGDTFSEPVQVSDPERERVVAPALVLGPDHAVHVAYYDLRNDALDYQGLEGPVWDGEWALVVASSADGGRRFGQGVVAEEAVVPPERVMLIFTMAPPALVADGKRLCLAWVDGRHGDPDIFARCSPDLGRKWSPPRRVNDDPVGNGRHQSLPRLGVAPNGRIDAVFYDRRAAPANLATDVFYTFSTDGGKSFAPNVRLTREYSSVQAGQRYLHGSAKGLVEFGSRLGLLSRDDSAVAAWADTRNSRPPGTGQDLFVTTVRPGAAKGLGRNGAAGLILAAAGLVCLGVGLAGRRRASPGLGPNGAPPTGVEEPA